MIRRQSGANPAEDVARVSSTRMMGHTLMNSDLLKESQIPSGSAEPVRRAASALDGNNNSYNSEKVVS